MWYADGLVNDGKTQWQLVDERHTLNVGVPVCLKPKKIIFCLLIYHRFYTKSAFQMFTNAGNIERKRLT